MLKVLKNENLFIFNIKFENLWITLFFELPLPP